MLGAATGHSTVDLWLSKWAQGQDDQQAGGLSTGAIREDKETCGLDNGAWA
jgi:hypothetical protein